jgi:D-alanine-D-alanine ligase
LYYADEGRDCRYSSKWIQESAARVKNVLVLRPGNEGDSVVNARRGQRRYGLSVEGEPLRLGKATKKPDVLNIVFDKLKQCTDLTSRKDRVAVATLELKTRHMPMLLPHHLTATLLVSYPDEKVADHLEKTLREILCHKGIRFRVETLSARPPMKDRRANASLAKTLGSVAERWEIPLRRESSVWPSVAGLVPASTGAVCGVGPVARNIYTPDESVDRISLLQRTLLIAEFLANASN